MAITWRNVDAPDFRGVGQLLQTSSNFLDKGTEQINAILQERVQAQQKAWDKGEEANTLQAVNQIRQMQNLDDVKNADLNALTQPYGAQVNAAAVLDSLTKQSGVIAQNKQTEATVRDLNDQDKYGGIYAQARQALANGDLKTGEQLASQLGSSKFGQAIAEDIAAARAQNFSQWEARQRLANDNARLTMARTQIDKENNLNAQKNAVAGIIETARVKGEDPAPAIAQYLGGLKDKSNNPILSAFADSETARIYTPSKEQTELTTPILSGLAEKRKEIQSDKAAKILQVQHENMLDNTYLGNVGRVGSPNDVNTYVGGGDNQISGDVYNLVNKKLKLAKQPPIDVGSELPTVLPQAKGYLDDTKAENIVNYLKTQRMGLRIYQSKVAEINKQASEAEAALDLRVADFNANSRRAFAANDKTAINQILAAGSKIQAGKISIPIDTPETLALKKQLQAEAERDAAIKQAEYERNLAAQGRTTTPQSRAAKDIAEAAKDIKAPIGYKPGVALSNLMDFSNVKEDAALYKEWKKEMQAQGKPATSRAAWEKFKADYVKNKK